MLTMIIEKENNKGRTTEESIKIANKFISDFSIQSEDLKHDIYVAALQHRNTVSERALRMYFYEKLDDFIDTNIEKQNNRYIGVAVPASLIIKNI